MIAITDIAVSVFIAAIGVIVLGLSLIVEWRNAQENCQVTTGVMLMVVGLMVIIMGIVMWTTKQSYQAYSGVLSTGSTVIAIGLVSIIRKLKTSDYIKKAAYAITAIGFVLFLIFLVLSLISNQPK